MKTPEELAIEFADECVTDAGYMLSKAGFLAGYQAAAPQWISVKDRLPENNGPILMWSGRLEDVPTCAAAGYELWNWSTEYSPHDFRLSAITHWMPLPQPPKEEA
jgi:hypothetical protein